MDVIIALGHFCDTHGPCVILSTNKTNEVPEKPLETQNVPVCNACHSIQLDTVYACKDEKYYYISTRTHMIENIANILKDVVLRSLSVESVQEEYKGSGTMYFGDDNRGHVISHVFDIKDSLARGFKRKYCIVVLSKYQIPLLQHYNFIESNLKKISKELQEKASKVNTAEQIKISQKKVRQTEGHIKPLQRSLSQLVGERYIFAHLHMWFVFLLRAEIFRIIPHNVPEYPINCSQASELRKIYKEMPENIFQIVIYCTLTGIKIEEENISVVKYFRQLLPKDFILPTSGKVCKISKYEGKWKTKFNGLLPKTLPSLLMLIEESLSNSNMPDVVLPFHLTSLIMRWFNIACVISWAPTPCNELMRTLEVRNCDLPLLSYWIPQTNACMDFCENGRFTSELQR